MKFPLTFELLKWHEMRQGVVIDGVGGHEGFRGGEGGYEPGRNPYFKKWSTRTMRPVVSFEKCTKCTLCWVACPDTCFDVTPDGFFDANMEAWLRLRRVRGHLSRQGLHHDGERSRF